MKYVLRFFALCGFLIVAAAVCIKFIPDNSQQNNQLSINPAQFKSNSNTSGSLDLQGSGIAFDSTVPSASVFDIGASSPSPTLTKQPEITSSPKHTNKPSPSPETSSKSNSKSFFVADAPYDMVGNVEFTTLININNRLSDTYEPNDLVLASDYIDSSLVTLNSKYTYADRTALLAFNDMILAASRDGIEDFFLRNAYRSFDMQVGLWNKRLREDSRYGRRRDVPLGSAYPGSSEHQTGLAFDIMCTSSPEASDAFMNTSNYKWLRSNSYKFGFILRYAADKTDITGIKFEPYHYRYVGTELATQLYMSGLSLEEYYDQPIVLD